MKHMKKIVLSIVSLLLLGIGTGCSDYLDIVPEGVPSMDNACLLYTSMEAPVIKSKYEIQND